VPAVKCSYREGRRRCQLKGTGNPPLCNAHRIALAETLRPRRPGEVLAETLVDFLQGRPINRDATIGAFDQIINQWVTGLGADYHPDVTQGEAEDAAHRRAARARNGRGQGIPWWSPGTARGHRDAPQDPREREQQQRERTARRILGFRPDQALDERMVKDAKKRLARAHHSDLGGSDDRMAAINAAADVLLASLKPQR